MAIQIPQIQEDEINKFIEKTNKEVVRVYGQLSEMTLNAYNGWMRYEMANRVNTQLYNERLKIAQELSRLGLQLMPDGSIVSVEELSKKV